MARFCPECGTKRAAEAPFCEECGHAFAAPLNNPPPESDPQSETGAALPHSEDLGEANDSESLFTRKKRALAIGGGAVALVAVVGALWWTGVSDLPGLPVRSAPSESATLDTELMPVAFGAKCGFVNSEGRIVINPQFDYAGLFVRGSGVAPVQLGGKWGLIDSAGQFVVNPQYDFLETSGTDDAFVVQLGSQMGIIDPQGAFIINPQFQAIGRFDAEGRARVGTGTQWGFIDRRGNYLVPPRFDWISGGTNETGETIYFPHGLAAARSGDRWGYIDPSGNWLINPQFASATQFGASELAAVQMGGNAPSATGPTDVNDMARAPAVQPRWGYIDRTGSLVIAPQFTSAEPFSEAGLAPVEMSGIWGYIDRTGALKINPQFKYAGPFVRRSNGWIAPVAIDQGSDQPQWRFGLIDQNGAFVVQPQFDSIGSFDAEGRAVVSVGNSNGLIDETGRFVAPPIYLRLFRPPGAPHYFYAKAGAINAGQGILEMGWMDGDGHILSTLRGGICGEQSRDER